VVKAISWRIPTAIITSCVALAMTGKLDFAARSAPSARP